MRKILALLIVFMMFAICSPSFGLFLVYKMSSTVKGADDVAGTPVTVPLKAYLIMNFNNDDGGYQDANLLIYGKDKTGSKVYFQLNDSDSNNLLYLGVRIMGLTDKYLFIGFGCYGQESPFDFEGLLMGKMKPKDIGFGPQEQWVVPSALKGAFTVWMDMLLDMNQDISGSGNLSATLDNTTTKMFNAGGWIQDDAVAYITGLLQNTDYSRGSLPPP